MDTQLNNRNYLENDSGQVAVFFALIAVPLLVMMSACLDYTHAVSQKSRMKNALDAAVIAAMAHNAMSFAEQEELAKEYFYDNYIGSNDVKLIAKATEGRVEMSGSTTADITIGRAVGMQEISINSKSAAEIAIEHTICVLALSKHGKGVEFGNQMRYRSPTCTVHSNSTSPEAIHSKGLYPPHAKSFCAVGGVEGIFKPHGKGQCAEIADPYAHVDPPFEMPCTPAATLQGAGPEMMKKKAVVTITDDVVLTPGTYCGGVIIQGRNVTFAPGDYLMLDGPLKIEQGAQAFADGVTIAFAGQKSDLKIKSGSEFKIKAPSTGPRAGLAFMQIVSPKDRLATKETGKIGIEGGSGLEVTGTMYFPTKKIEIKKGASRVGSRAPATSFIGYSVKFDGDEGAMVEVAVDHLAAGLPPLKPTAEDGVRLVE